MAVRPLLPSSTGRAVHIHHTVAEGEQARDHAPLLVQQTGLRGRRPPREQEVDLRQHDLSLRLHPAQSDDLPHAQVPHHVGALVLCAHSRPLQRGAHFAGRIQEAAEEHRETPVQAGKEQGCRAHFHKDDGLNVSSVPHAEGDVPEGQVHIQHEAVQAHGGVHNAADAWFAGTFQLLRRSFQGKHTYSFSL